MLCPPLVHVLPHSVAGDVELRHPQEIEPDPVARRPTLLEQRRANNCSPKSFSAATKTSPGWQSTTTQITSKSPLQRLRAHNLRRSPRHNWNRAVGIEETEERKSWFWIRPPTRQEEYFQIWDFAVARREIPNWMGAGTACRPTRSGTQWVPPLTSRTGCSTQLTEGTDSQRWILPTRSGVGRFRGRSAGRCLPRRIHLQPKYRLRIGKGGCSGCSGRCVGGVCARSVCGRAGRSKATAPRKRGQL